MATRKIFISKGTDDGLKLRDSEGHDPGNDHLTTNVSPGDTVYWEIDPRDPSIYAIKGIVKKDNSPANLLTGPPVKDGNKYKWTVFDNPALRGQEEYYYIKYKITEGGSIKHDDPKMRMT